MTSPSPAFSAGRNSGGKNASDKLGSEKVSSGWPTTDAQSSLRHWFASLSPQERFQALSIQESTWVRLYCVLYRKEPRNTSGARRPLRCKFERDYILKIHDKVHRNSEKYDKHRQHMSGGMGSSMLAPSPAATAVPSLMSWVRQNESHAFGSQQGAGLRGAGYSGAILSGGDASSPDQLDENDPAIEAGERLQEAVRLCGAMASTSFFDTLTLSEEALSNPSELMDQLRLCSGGGFLSAPLPEALAKKLALSGGAQPDLIEMPWLQMRGPSPVSLCDLLVNRLELSLWASFWASMRHQQAGSGALTLCTPGSTQPLVDLLEASRTLGRYWRKINMDERLELVRGLPAAAEEVHQGLDDTAKKLLFPPIAWVVRDEGAAVRQAASRVQTASADCVMAELIALESSQDTPAQGRGKKSKKKKRRGASIDIHKVPSSTSPPLIGDEKEEEEEVEVEEGLVDALTSSMVVSGGGSEEGSSVSIPPASSTNEDGAVTVPIDGTDDAASGVADPGAGWGVVSRSRRKRDKLLDRGSGKGKGLASDVEEGADKAPERRSTTRDRKRQAGLGASSNPESDGPTDSPSAINRQQHVVAKGGREAASSNGHFPDSPIPGDVTLATMSTTGRSISSPSFAQALIGAVSPAVEESPSHLEGGSGSSTEATNEAVDTKVASTAVDASLAKAHTAAGGWGKGMSFAQVVKSANARSAGGGSSVHTASNTPSEVSDATAEGPYLADGARDVEIADVEVVGDSVVKRGSPIQTEVLADKPASEAASSELQKPPPPPNPLPQPLKLGQSTSDDLMPTGAPEEGAQNQQAGGSRSGDCVGSSGKSHDKVRGKGQGAGRKGHQQQHRSRNSSKGSGHPRTRSDSSGHSCGSSGHHSDESGSAAHQGSAVAAVQTSPAMGMWWMHDTTSGGAAVASMANGFAYPDYASFDEPTLIARLDANIDSFMSKLSTALEPRRRAWASVVSYVKETIADIWSEADVELYGSCYTGLELPSSDVDVVVTGIDGKHYSYGVAPSEPYSAEETVGHLRRLASVLSGAPWVRSMKVIETASVPVIKIVADPNCGARVEAPEKSSKVTASNSSSAPDPNALSPSPQTVEENGPAGCFSWVGIGAGCDSVPLDISFASPLHGGVASSKWVRQYVQDGKYHFSQSATLVLKEVLCQRGLNQPWSGGLSSYSLINMMITVLQEVEKQRVQDRKLEERAISMRDKDQSDDGSANSGNHADDPSSCFEQMTSFEDLGVSETDLSSEDLSDVTPGLCLLRFLEFYGRAFDSSHFGISVGRGPLRNPFLVDHPVDPHTGLPAVTSALTIEDPLDMNRNVAHSCFGFPQVQWLFANCLSALELRGPEMMRRDSDANLLQLLMYL